VFAFGQRGGYYFESPSRWEKGQLPSNLQQLFNENKVESTYCVALGAENSFAVSYKGKDGLLHIQCSGKLPQALRTWLLEEDSSGVPVRELEKLKVSLGPFNTSFFATDGTSWRWENLPAVLQKALNDRLGSNGRWLNQADKPRMVVLGAHDTYVLINHGGGGQWELDDYKALDEVIRTLAKREDRFDLIENLVLDQHRLNAFVMQLRDGILLCSTAVIPHAQDALQTMKQTIKDDALAAQKRELESKLAQLQLATRLQKMQNELLVLERRRAQEMNDYAQMINGLNALNLGLGAMSLFGGGLFNLL